MDNGAAAAAVSTDRRLSSSSSGSKKRNEPKGLVDYTSEVSSEDFSGPEDGEVDSDVDRQRTSSVPKTADSKLALVANASPIDDEDFDLGKAI